jgi:hypothetical protein
MDTIRIHRSFIHRMVEIHLARHCEAPPSGDNGAMSSLRMFSPSPIFYRMIQMESPSSPFPSCEETRIFPLAPHHFFGGDPHKRNARPEVRSILRETAARKISSLPQISTFSRARVMAV